MSCLQVSRQKRKKTLGDVPQEFFPWDELPLELKVMIAELHPKVFWPLVRMDSTLHPYFGQLPTRLRALKNGFVKFHRNVRNPSCNREAIQESYRLPDGRYHREGGPALIWYYRDGEIEREEYRQDGKKQREDGPINLLSREWNDIKTGR